MPQDNATTVSTVTEVLTRIKAALGPVEELLAATDALRLVVQERQREAAQAAAEVAGLIQQKQALSTDLANLQAKYNDVRKLWDSVKAAAENI